MGDLRENIGLILTRRARCHPEREALVEVERGRRLSYRELNARANRVAHALRSLGVSPGDRVAVLQGNGAEFVAAYFGAAKIGAVLVPLNWRLAADELEFILGDSGATVLIHDADFAPVVEDLRRRRTAISHWCRVGPPAGAPAGGVDFESLVEAGDPGEPDLGAGDDDLLFIMYTSGTTGRPKGAMHSHASMLWGSLTVNLTWDTRDGDRDLVVLPLFHIGALLPLTVVLHRGGTSVVMRTYDTRRALHTIQQERITTSLLVTTIMRRLIEHPDRPHHDLSSLRWVIVGGEPVPTSLLDQCVGLGIAVLQDYGLTECGPATVTSAEEARAKPGSAGRAYLHTEVRVVDPDGRDVAPGGTGEVLVRGRHVMLGYWNRPEATREAIRDGWLHTGDLAMIDADGSVYIRERKSDLIISGGENVYPAEIEGVLATHPAVLEVAVIGVPSARWGESPLAVVVRRAGTEADPAELLAFCRGRIASYKIPRQVEFVARLPRNLTGKVLKQQLKQQFPGPIG